MARNRNRKSVAANDEVQAMEEPAVEVVPVQEEVASTAAPKSGFMNFYVAGKPSTQRNTDSEAHKRQGDVAILNALLAAIKANPEGQFITKDMADTAIATVNAKNKAFLGYAVKRGWIVRRNTEFDPLPAPVAPEVFATEVSE